MDDDPVRREVQERVLETAAELERLIKAKNSGGNQAPPPPVEQSQEEPAPQDDVPVDDSQAEGGGPALYMTLEGGELDRISKDRFIIGRGKHCDFVINSGKVSREHAVIIRENGDFFLEDLGSSNGTWFNKQRIKRRKIEDGDEYFICSEKVKFVYR
jgi:pSer/pThr/pTyr-binding forkhead associated (FHA) protein